MTKINQYVVFDKIKKLYWKPDRGFGNYGGFNEAWTFGRDDLYHQRTMLETDDGKLEIILKINKDGSLTRV